MDKDINKDIIGKILGFDIHVQILNGENKTISFLDFVNMENSYLSIEKNNEYPFYELDLHFECNGYKTEYCDDTIKKEERIFMSNEDIIRKRVAREILSMIETVCFSEEFKEYRVDQGSNGCRDLIIENIRKTYDV